MSLATPDADLDEAGARLATVIDRTGSGHPTS